MEHIPFPISMPNLATATKRPGLQGGRAHPIYDLRLRNLGPGYPRVRERIMKLSKVYSATCHHRY
jgi:hypothetical protein